MLNKTTAMQASVSFLYILAFPGRYYMYLNTIFEGLQNKTGFGFCESINLSVRFLFHWVWEWKWALDTSRDLEIWRILFLNVTSQGLPIFLVNKSILHLHFAVGKWLKSTCLSQKPQCSTLAFQEPVVMDLVVNQKSLWDGSFGDKYPLVVMTSPQLNPALLSLQWPSYTKCWSLSLSTGGVLWHFFILVMWQLGDVWIMQIQPVSRRYQAEIFKMKLFTLFKEKKAPKNSFQNAGFFILRDSIFSWQSKIHNSIIFEMLANVSSL